MHLHHFVAPGTDEACSRRIVVIAPPGPLGEGEVTHFEHRTRPAAVEKDPTASPGMFAEGQRIVVP